MPVISAERANSRRRAILESAAKVFVRKGYASASISEIADIAGVSDGLIYRYFNNKRALLDTVLSDFFEKIVTKLESAAVDEADFEVKVRNLISQHLTSYLEDLDFCRFFVSDVRSASDYHGSPIQKLNRRYTRIFVRVLEEGIAGGRMKPDLDARLVRDFVFGAVEHVAWRHAITGRAIDINDFARQLTEITLSGISVGAKRASSRAR